jgi:hypothetical protein
MRLGVLFSVHDAYHKSYSSLVNSSQSIAKLKRKALTAVEGTG